MRGHFEPRGVFIDTGAFGAFSIEGDANFHAASNIGDAIVAANLITVTTNFIVAETHALVLSRNGRAAALAALDHIDRSTTHIERITAADEVHARSILEQYDDKTYSYTDATSFAVMERLHVTDVFTFDRHFAQYGFSPLKPS